MKLSQRAKDQLRKLSKDVVEEFLRQAETSTSKIAKSNARIFRAELKRRKQKK